MKHSSNICLMSVHCTQLNRSHILLYPKACLTTTIWFWTGMLLVFAYNCNLRTNLVYKPTEAPIDTYQVNTILNVILAQLQILYI